MAGGKGVKLIVELEYRITFSILAIYSSRPAPLDFVLGQNNEGEEDHCSRYILPKPTLTFSNRSEREVPLPLIAHSLFTRSFGFILKIDHFIL